MIAAVKRNEAPNLLILNYTSDWSIRALTLIPSVFFTESVLQERSPLGPAARRAGWIGCNILLAKVPVEAKIPLVRGAVVTPPDDVRTQFKQYSRFGSIPWTMRGWTLDVFRIAHELGQEFTLEQMYRREQDLLSMHPANRHVRAKIRQQLQLLRDLGFLEFLGKARYRFASASQGTNNRR